MEDGMPLWWDDASYARYQAGDWDDPPEANTAPPAVNSWPTVEYDEPPF